MKYLIKGKLYEPILFGYEEDDWGDTTCGDCGCKGNCLHLEGCDIERCPCCGLQLISCDCGVIFRIENEKEINLEELINYQNKENMRQEKILKDYLKKIEKKNNNQM